MLLRRSLLFVSLCLVSACSGEKPTPVIIEASVQRAPEAEETTTPEEVTSAAVAEASPNDTETKPSRSLSPEAMIDLSGVGKQPSSTGEGQLTFTEIAKDFGAVDDSRPLEYDYAFTNTGQGPLKIVTVKASCGCMTTELDKTVFQPGEGDVIKLSWDPKGRGRQSKTIDVVTDSKSRTRFKLRAVAQVEQLVKITPIPSKFGDVPLGEGAKVRLFANSTDPGMLIKGVQCKDKMVNALAVPGESLGLPNHQWVIDVTLSPDTPKRRVSAKLELSIDAYSKNYGERISYTMEHTIQGQVLGKLKAEPFAFLVGLVEPKGDMNYTVTLTHVDGEEFQVSSAEVVGCPIPGAKVEVNKLTYQGKPAVRLVLAGNAGDYMGGLGGAVRITTSVSEDQKMSFPIMGKVGVKPQK